MTSSIAGLSGMTSSSVSSSAPLTSVDGLVSGLSTSSIIAQLLAVDAQPQQQLKNKAATDQAEIAAYQAVNTKLLALQTTAADAAAGSTWQAMSASSTSPAVTATASSSALPGTLTFDVTSLATAQAEVTSGTVSSPGSTVMSGTTISITKGGGAPVTITPVDGSLASVVSAINASTAGVRAAAVQVAPGSFKLQLTSTTTGANSAFTVTGIDGMGTLQTVATAADATLVVGAGTAGAYSITSATNTLTDVVPGLTLTLTGVASGVSVTTSSNPASIATKVNAMVSAANDALDTIAKYASYDSTNNLAGPLLSDQTVRNLQQQVLSLVGDSVSGTSTLSTVGLQLTKDGHLTFDTGAFTAAYAADPTGTAAMFQPGGRFTPAATGPALTGGITFHLATADTQPGPYDVQVTQAATRASATISAGTGVSAGDTITVSSGGATATYTADGTEDLPTLAARVNAAASAAGVAVAATVQNGTLTVSTRDYGASASLAVQATGGLTASSVTPGTDVTGAFLLPDGHGGTTTVAATGLGQLLTAPADAAGVGGLTLLVTMTPQDVAALGGGPAGTFTYTPGIAQRYTSLATAATDGVNGTLTLGINGITSEVQDLQQQISDWDLRLQMQQQMYQQQFSNLEVQLGQLKNQSSWLSGQLAGLGGSGGA